MLGRSFYPSFQPRMGFPVEGCWACEAKVWDPTVGVPEPLGIVGGGIGFRACHW